MRPDELGSYRMQTAMKLWYCLVACCWAASCFCGQAVIYAQPPLAGQGAEVAGFQVGDQVMVTRSVRVTYADGVSESIYPGTLLEIRQIQGDRFHVRWTQRCWISRSSVVPAEKYDVETMRGWLKRNTCTANRINLGAVLLLDGQYQAAKSYFDQALRLDVSSPWANNALGWYYATCPDESERNADWAVELCRQACELVDWKESMFVTSLACAYAEKGEFEKAVQLMKDALLMDQKFRGFRAKLLEKFESGQPYRAGDLICS